MTATTTHMEHLPALGGLLDHPREHPSSAARSLAAEVGAASSGAAQSLAAFADAVEALSLDELQELHARTFDLDPSCVLFLSVHLFGEESFKRAELMAGLAAVYAREDFSTGGEVPDHLGVVLRFAPRFSAEEWAELGRHCLPRPLQAVSAALDRAANPYSHLVEAVIRLLTLDFPALMEKQPCSTSSFLEPCHTSPSSPWSQAACGGCAPTPSAIPPSPPSSWRTAG